jgi:hypothetical protein
LEGREREWFAKVPAHVLRLAGTLCFLDWAIKDDGSAEPERIDAVFMSGAIRLVCDFFWPHSRAALRQIGWSERHVNSRRVLRWIKASGKTEVSLKDVRREALGQSLDADQTGFLLDGLVKAGWLRPSVKPAGPKGGKRIHRWQVNPLLWSGAETAETAGTDLSEPDELVMELRERKSDVIAVLVGSKASVDLSKLGRSGLLKSRAASSPEDRHKNTEKRLKNKDVAEVLDRTEPSEDRICRQCNGPVDGKERLYTVDAKPIWLHPECHRFYIDRVYR